MAFRRPQETPSIETKADFETTDKYNSTSEKAKRQRDLPRVLDFHLPSSVQSEKSVSKSPWQHREREFSPSEMGSQTISSALFQKQQQQQRSSGKNKKTPERQGATTVRLMLVDSFQSKHPTHKHLQRHSSNLQQRTNGREMHSQIGKHSKSFLPSIIPATQ